MCTPLRFSHWELNITLDKTGKQNVGGGSYCGEVETVEHSSNAL